MGNGVHPLSDRNYVATRAPVVVVRAGIKLKAVCLCACGCGECDAWGSIPHRRERGVVSRRGVLSVLFPFWFLILSFL